MLKENWIIDSVSINMPGENDMRFTNIDSNIDIGYFFSYFCLHRKIKPLKAFKTTKDEIEIFKIINENKNT